MEGKRGYGEWYCRWCWLCCSLDDLLLPVAANLRYQSSNCPVCRARKLTWGKNIVILITVPLSLPLLLILSFSVSAFRALLQIQALEPLDPNELIDDDEMTGNPKVCIRTSDFLRYIWHCGFEQVLSCHVIKKITPRNYDPVSLSIVLHTRISVCPPPSSSQWLQARQRWDWARGWRPNARKPTTKTGGGGRGRARSGRNRRSTFITTVSGFAIILLCTKYMYTWYTVEPLWLFRTPLVKVSWLKEVSSFQG